MVPGVATATPKPSTSNGQATKKPTTAAEAGDQLTSMSQRLEIVAEQYNAARVKLARRTHDAVVARTEVKHLQRQVHTLQGKVKKVAISAYQNGHLTSFSSFVTSSSPQSFLDQLSTLDVIAQKQTSVLTGLTTAKKEAAKASERATAAETDARRTTAKLAVQKHSILGQVDNLKKLRGQLSAKELEAWQRQQAAPTLASARKIQQTQDDPPDQTPPPSSSATGKAAIAVKAAEAELGKPYSWGAAGPDSFDCSGLMLWAWGKAGVSLPHQSGDQYNVGTHVSEDQLQPGDLVFYYSPIHHVAMYVGHGMVIQAPDFGVPVGYAPVNSMPYTGATRVG
jgi:cell wall-associated NlpC family hydrolase